MPAKNISISEEQKLKLFSLFHGWVVVVRMWFCCFCLQTSFHFRKAAIWDPAKIHNLQTPNFQASKQQNATKLYHHNRLDSTVFLCSYSTRISKQPLHQFYLNNSFNSFVLTITSSVIILNLTRVHSRDEGKSCVRPEFWKSEAGKGSNSRKI